MLDLPKPQPDFDSFRKVLFRQELPKRVHFVEILPDLEMAEGVVSRLPGDDGNDELRPRRRWLRFWHLLGYDYVTLIGGYVLPFGKAEADDTAALNRGKRVWIQESSGLIANRKDFDQFPWPDPTSPLDMSAFEQTANLLPDGMKIIGLTTGVFEQAIWIMGHVNLSLALQDDPELVREVFRRIGELVVSAHREMASWDAVGALWLGETRVLVEVGLVVVNAEQHPQALA